MDQDPTASEKSRGRPHRSTAAENGDRTRQPRARHEIVRLESGLFILEIIVGIAPLLGLLGAVSGLVSVFAAFGADAGSQDPHGIAKGISEALSTTIVGLAIAIPSLIAYSYFSKKIESMAADMESLVADLLIKCYYHQMRQLSTPPPASPSARSRRARHTRQARQSARNGKRNDPQAY